MNKKFTVQCIDINTPYCPCLLAVTNHCVFCSQLQGADTCDCDWSGICILYEQKWQSNTKEMSKEQASTCRIEMETQFVIKQEITPSVFHLEFAVSDALAHSLAQVGTFVFLRNALDQTFYDFPVGILAVHDHLIEVVIEAVGPKSKRLMMTKEHKIMVRGPYFNGIFGQPWIEHISCGKILLIAGGMGQPPAVPIVKKLVANQNKVTAWLAPGKIGKVFIAQEIQGLGAEVSIFASLRRDGMEKLSDLLKTAPPDLVISTGPDEQHASIINIMEEVGVNIPMAATNNASMCCGEGVCGACAKKTRSGKQVRTCKAQLPFVNFIQE